MFEAGKFYHFRLWEPNADGGAISEFGAYVTAVSFPLITCKGLDAIGHDPSERVINTASLAFIGATQALEDPHEFLERLARGREYKPLAP